MEKPDPTNRRYPILFLLGGLALFATGAVVALKIGGGAIEIGWSEILRWSFGGGIDPVHAQVLRDVRLPRVLMAAVAGAVLSCAGVIYQALLRNPLADPYTLGVSGGATLGAVLTIALEAKLGRNAYLQQVPLMTFAALAGALLAIALIYSIARSWGLFSTSTLILAGVTLNLIFASLILLIEYFADYTQVYQMIRWMMGGLDVIGYADFQILGPVTVLGLALALWHRRDLDLLSVDPVAAASLGVKVAVVRWRLLLAASLMTGVVVASAGPIGFVGLVIPHGVRMIAGASHHRVLPASILAGALFLLACDTVAQNILGVNEVPVGVITSMLGGPFFVYLLLRRRGRMALWSD